MKGTVLSVPDVLVELVNGQPTTTSLDVAEHFGKRHRDVLRAIRNLDCSPEFTQRNFAQGSQSISQPNGGQATYPLVRMSRDGFTFLCMGFTGPGATKWKEAYIQAFNALENRVRSQEQPPPLMTQYTEANAKALMHHIEWLVKNWRDGLEPALRAMDSPIAAVYHDHVASIASLGRSVTNSLHQSISAKAGHNPLPLLNAGRGADAGFYAPASRSVSGIPPAKALSHGITL